MEVPSQSRTSVMLIVEDLAVRFKTTDGDVTAAQGITFQINAGESLGVVGESGSGKSQVFLSIMGLLAPNGRATGQISFQGQQLLELAPKALDRIRGAKISIIFQDPMTSLNPYLRIGIQLTEVLQTHMGMTSSQARGRALELLGRVRIPEPRKRIDMYPHEFSGGMRQRIMIAMALLCRPSLLIADEPTTALDVTVQAQILGLLAELRREFNSAIVLISHDLGVVAGLCDRIMVMYAGRIAETGTARQIFYHPQHPYSQGLLMATPRPDQNRARSLISIPGQPPNLQRVPSGCPFSPRCPYVFDRCRVEPPKLREIGSGRSKSCHLEVLPEPRGSETSHP